MRPTRLTQPLRKGTRVPSSALKAAMKGSTSTGYNPMDVHRATAKLAKAGSRKQRPPRPTRPARPPR